MSQKHIRSLARPIKFMLALFVQLAPGSRKGQSSSEKRTLALRKCSEGRWVPNHGDGLPGVIQETLRVSRFSAITDLRIPCRSHHAGFTLGSHLNLAPVMRLVHPPPLLLVLPSQEALQVEGSLPAQNKINRSPQLGSQDRKRLGFAVPSGNAA